VENDAEDISHDAMSRHPWRKAGSSGPAKALERQYAALGSGDRVKSQANVGNLGLGADREVKGIMNQSVPGRSRLAASAVVIRVVV